MYCFIRLQLRRIRRSFFPRRGENHDIGEGKRGLVEVRILIVDKTLASSMSDAVLKSLSRFYRGSVNGREGLFPACKLPYNRQNVLDC